MIALLISSSAFDFAFIPEQAKLFFNVRLLGSSLILFLTAFLIFLPWAKKEPKFFLSFMLATFGSINIWMFTRSGLYLPIYLVAQVLLVFGISFYRFTYVISALNILILTTLVWLGLSSEVSLIHFNITSYYLVMAMVVSLLASYITEKYRFRAYKVTHQFKQEQEINAELLLELEQLSKTDELTKIANRRQWQEVISKHWNNGTEFGIALIDIDKFKQVNDENGHKAGDAALLAIAQIMEDLSDKEDLASRLGGDEMAILFVEKEFTEIYEICKDLSHRVGQIKLKEFPKASLSISIGIAIREANDISYSVTMQRSDKQLYLAKNNRGSICFANKYLGSNFQNPKEPN